MSPIPSFSAAIRTPVVSPACRRSSWRSSSSGDPHQGAADTEPEGDLSDRAVIDRHVARIIVPPGFDRHRIEGTNSGLRAIAGDGRGGRRHQPASDRAGVPFRQGRSPSARGQADAQNRRPGMQFSSPQPRRVPGSTKSHRAAFNHSPRLRRVKARWKGTFASSRHARWPRSSTARARTMPP
jgi:hypothetical protein